MANRGTILQRAEVKELLSRYVVAELWTDRQNPMDLENDKVLNERYGGALPLYVTFSPDGRETGRIGGRPSAEKFAEFLERGLR